MAKACFNPEAALELWKSMDQCKSQKGRSVPALLSTHPSSIHRIENIKRWLPQATKIYESRWMTIEDDLILGPKHDFDQLLSAIKLRWADRGTLKRAASGFLWYSLLKSKNFVAEGMSARRQEWVTFSLVCCFRRQDSRRRNGSSSRVSEVFRIYKWVKLVLQITGN